MGAFLGLLGGGEGDVGGKALLFDCCGCCCRCERFLFLVLIERRGGRLMSGIS